MYKKRKNSESCNAFGDSTIGKRINLGVFNSITSYVTWGNLHKIS